MLPKSPSLTHQCCCSGNRSFKKEPGQEYFGKRIGNEWKTLKKNEKHSEQALTEWTESESLSHPGTQQGAAWGLCNSWEQVQGLRAHQRGHGVKESLPPQRHHRTSVPWLRLTMDNPQLSKGSPQLRLHPVLIPPYCNSAFVPRE